MANETNAGVPKKQLPSIREIVLNAQEFYKQEKQLKQPIIPFKRVNERVAAITGISLRTVSRIIREDRLAEVSSRELVTLPENSKEIKKDEILIENYEVGVLRQKIREYYRMKKGKATLKRLHHVLKVEIGYQGSRESLRQHVEEMGLTQNKTPNSHSTKCEIMKWLRSQNINFSEEYTKVQLLEIVNRNEPEPVNIVPVMLFKRFESQ